MKTDMYNSFYSVLRWGDNNLYLQKEKAGVFTPTVNGIVIIRLLAPKPKEYK